MVPFMRWFLKTRDFWGPHGYVRIVRGLLGGRYLFQDSAVAALSSSLTLHMIW